jgi:hypothetical protein
VDSFLAKARMKKAPDPTLTMKNHLALFKSSSEHHPVKHLL